jgi:hypothetical protein
MTHSERKKTERIDGWSERGAQKIIIIIIMKSTTKEKRLEYRFTRGWFLWNQSPKRNEFSRRGG